MSPRPPAPFADAKTIGIGSVEIEEEFGSVYEVILDAIVHYKAGVTDDGFRRPGGRAGGWGSTAEPNRRRGSFAGRRGYRPACVAANLAKTGGVWFRSPQIG